MSTAVSQSRKSRGWAFDIIAYVLSMLLVLTSNTLPMLLGNRQDLGLAGVLACAVAMILGLWYRRRLPRRFVEGWLLWALFLVIVYVLIALAGGDSGGRRMALVFSLLAVFPLLFEFLVISGRLGPFFRSFVNVVAVVAALSLVLWLLGPISGTLSPNCVIENHWTGTDYYVMTPGYYWLQYTPQTMGVANGMMAVVRNTSFFAEAPMYSLVLTTAFVVEAFFTERPRRLVLVLLAVTVVTTISTAGIVAVLFAALFRLLLSSQGKSRQYKVLLTLAFLVLLAVVLAFSRQLIDTKLGSGSGSIRLDDLQAGMRAWSNNYLLGNGFDSTDLVNTYKSAFRANNMGFSNTLMDVLSKGGIVYLLVYLVPALGYLRISNPSWKVGYLVFLFAWLVTLSTNLPVTFVFFALGFVGLVGDQVQAVQSENTAGTVGTEA